MMHSFDR